MQQPIMSTQPEQLPPPEGETALQRPAVSAGTLQVSPLSWLTVERAAYLGLALLALVLRLVNLGAHPLSNVEAEQALVGWHVFQGESLHQVGYSPLMITLNLLAFLLLGSSEFAARLGPALLGVILVLLPYGLRRHLGKTGALAASLLFAISPTSLYLSRTLNGDIGAAVGGLALVVGLFGWLDREPDRPSPGVNRLRLAAAGLVLLVTSSPSAYSTLVLLLGFLALAAAVGGKGYATPAREGLAALRNQVVNWSEFGLLFFIGLVVVATGLLFNMNGLAATADLLTSWILGFAPAIVALNAYPAIFLLSLYEPLILLTGLFGLSTGLLRRRLIDLFLGWWIFGGVALDLLRSGRTAGEVLVPLVPLTLLGGLAVGMLWTSLRTSLAQPGNRSWQLEGIIALSGLIIGGYAYISLMSYTRAGGLTFWLPLAALGLFLGLTALFQIWYGGTSALRGSALAAVLLLLAFTIATATRLNGGQVADARQPLIRAPAAEGLPNLVAALEQLSEWRAGDPYLLDVLADRRLGPAVEWQLRHFDNLVWADRVSQWSAGVPAAGINRRLNDFEVILTPVDDALQMDEGYAGQDFSVLASWSPAGLRSQSLIRWIILRTANTPLSFEQAVLWVKQSGTQ